MGLWERSRVGVGVACSAALIALLVASAPAAAAPKRITGKLDKPGYTVIALAADGEAATDQTKRGRFSLRPPAKRITLHLRSKDGTYAGPIVVTGQERGTRAIMGLKAGTQLGKVDVRAQKGYAKVARKVPEGALDKKRLARAKRGVPIGAGNFGHVRSKPPRDAAPGDTDFDGIPDPLDTDDDGDLVLDNLDRGSAARAAQAAPFQFHVTSELPLGSQSANANAPQVSDPGALLPLYGRMGFARLEGDPGTPTELDCGGEANSVPPPPWVGGLTYCSLGGTGKIWKGEIGLRWDDDHPRFPDEFDADGDGFGELPGGPLLHGATARDTTLDPTIPQPGTVGTGDVLIQRLIQGGVEREFASSVQFVFATVPTLVSYDDGAGNGRTVPYPYEPPPGDAGYFPVADSPDDADSDVELTLTFWRPQRRPIAKEPCLSEAPPCTWVDIGGLNYGATVQYIGPPPGESGPDGPGGPCPQTAFPEEGLSDELSLAQGETLNFTTLTDLAPSRRADPQNTFIYTLNLTQCLASMGVDWQSGQGIGVQFLANAASSTDNASQNIAFQRE